VTPARASLYITNWSLAEPLCRSQSVAYLEALSAAGYPSCLITFERAPYRLSAPETAAATSRLASKGICWHPLTYHARTSLPGAALDIARGLVTAIGAIVRHQPRIVHSRSSVPAAFGLVAAGVLGRRFLYDADAELAEEYVQCGHWTRGGLRYRVLSAMERVCRRRADAIVVLTQRLRAEFTAQGVHAPVTVIPCCVDVARFRFEEGARRARRRELAVADDEKLLVYAGKIGVRYMVDESLAFLAAVRRRSSSARLLVLTHDDPARFRGLATDHGLEDAVIVRRAAPEEVPGWLSAADAGLSLVLPTVSARGTSPIKTSEYLAAGLPVVTTPAIGDISAAIERGSLGVVVADQTPSGMAAAAERLDRLWSDASAVRARCAAWARTELDVDTVATERYVRVYEALLSTGPASAAVPASGSNE